MVVSQKQLQDVINQYNEILERIETRLAALEAPNPTKAAPKKATS